MIIVIVVLLVLAFLVAGIVLFFTTRKLGSALPDDQKPEWMQAVTAHMENTDIVSDGSQERMASPIAEAIEALVKEKLAAIPEFENIEIDLGSASDGSLEIWVNGEKFTDIDSLKDEKLQQVFREAVASFNK